MKHVRIVEFVVSFSLMAMPWVCAADATSVATTEKQLHSEIYAESSFYKNYDLVNESRLRSLYPIKKSNNLQSEVYLGISLQYQSPGAPAKYFDDTVTPFVGIQTRIYKYVNLQIQGGARTLVKSQNDTTEWDPRTILSGGNIWFWSLPLQLFSEVYGESAFVPRIDSTPVTVVWGKQGYRLHLNEKIYFDPYVEVFSRESRDADLGPTQTDLRAGLRSGWQSSGWSVAGLLYRSIKNQESQAEGLLVVGGQF